VLNTTTIVNEAALSGQAVRWMLSQSDAARALRRLAFFPAAYASASRYPQELPANVMQKLALSPRTTRLVSAAMLANSTLDLRPTQPGAYTMQLAILEGEVLALLARRLGITLVSSAFDTVIESSLLQALETSLGKDTVTFARESAPLLRPAETLSVDWTLPDLPAAIDGAGYRVLLQALYGEPPWVTNRFRFKCPTPLNDRIDVTSLSLETTYAVAIRVARQLPKPWSTLFAPKAK
jgi:YOP proteins translocation protein K (YscK)